MKKLSRLVLEEKEKRRRVGASVASVEKAGVNRVLWSVHRVLGKLLLAPEGCLDCFDVALECMRCRGESVCTRWCDRVLLVVLAMHLCAVKGRQKTSGCLGGAWSGLVEDAHAVTCMSHILRGSDTWGVVGCVMEYLGAARGEDATYLSIVILQCMTTTLRHQDYIDSAGEDFAFLVRTCFHHVVVWLCGRKDVEDPRVVECIKALDAILLEECRGVILSSSGGKEDMAMLESWLEGTRQGVVSPACIKLSSRVMLLTMDGMSLDDVAVLPVPVEEDHRTAEYKYSIHGVEQCLDHILYWKKVEDSNAECGGSLSLAMHVHVTWWVGETLFGPSDDPHLRMLPVKEPNPISPVKILFRILSEEQGAGDSLLAWVLASKIQDVEEQQWVLQYKTATKKRVSLERIRTGGSCNAMVGVHPWVDAEMLLIGNKLAMDDTSIHGIIVGEDMQGNDSAALASIRSLLFPCVLFCPYGTLSSIFNTSVSRRADAWLLVAMCRLYPNIAQLPCIQRNDHGSSYACTTELTRLIFDALYAPGMMQKPDAFMYVVRMLIQHGIVNTVNVCDWVEQCLAHPNAHVLEFVDMILSEPAVTSKIDWTNCRRDALLNCISQCLYYLELDNRYKAIMSSEGAYPEIDGAITLQSFIREQTPLEHIQRILLKLIALSSDMRQTILSTVEHQGYPWARLHFGIEFSPEEAQYIIDINPKPSILKHCNARLHQTLELASLGSLHTNMLLSCISDYTSMESCRKDIMASVQCLVSVCTLQEMMHVSSALEIMCGNIHLAAHAQDLAALHVAPQCSVAMVADIFMRLVDTKYSNFSGYQVNAMRHVCHYCLERSSPTMPLLTARLLKDMISLTGPEEQESTQQEACIATLGHQLIAAALPPHHQKILLSHTLTHIQAHKAGIVKPSSAESVVAVQAQIHARLQSIT